MQYKFTEIQKKLQYGLLKCHSIPTKESERLETLEQQHRRNKVSWKSETDANFWSWFGKQISDRKKRRTKRRRPVLDRCDETTDAQQRWNSFVSDG